MRTLDTKWLSTNPTDEEAEVSLGLSVPEAETAVENNPDGTRPQVSFDFTGDTYMSVLQAMTQLHEDENHADVSSEIVAEFITRHYTEADFDGQITTDEEFVACISSTDYGWEEYELQMTLASASGATSVVMVTIKAPSPVVATKALKSVTRPQSVRRLAIELSPTIENDNDFMDGDEEEVLVVN